MPDEKLSPKHREFIRIYLTNGRNATAAYRKVYPKNKNPDVDSAKLLVKPRIRDFLRQHEQKLEAKFEISQERILKELAKVAFGNIAEIVDNDGNIIDDDRAAFISGYSRSHSSGAEGSSESFSFSTQNKTKALELLGKHVGLWKDGNRLGSGEADRRTIIERLRGRMRKGTG